MSSSSGLFYGAAHVSPLNTEHLKLWGFFNHSPRTRCLLRKMGEPTGVMSIYPSSAFSPLFYTLIPISYSCTIMNNIGLNFDLVVIISWNWSEYQNILINYFILGALELLQKCCPALPIPLSKALSATLEKLVRLNSNLEQGFCSPLSRFITKHIRDLSQTRN